MTNAGRWSLLYFSLSMFALANVATGQESNPFAGDSKAARAGEYEFRINCAFCHGLGARGGGRGPDLSKAVKRHGSSDADIFHTISGGVAGTAMPANGTNGQGVGMTDAEIWQIITYLRSIEVKAPAASSGSAAHGKQLFEGDASCSNCHMVNGKGGRLGPDLSGVSISRTTSALSESVRNPSQHLAWGLTEATKEFAQEYRSVTVVAEDGKQIKGVTLNEDQFTVQIMDMAQGIHSFDKSKLRSFRETRESLMPAYSEKDLSEQDLKDILAYLASLGAE
ncbi:MAG: c-type cytochrome [Acidobacteria bacterium]|nr:c-type cytochrome [Acidobacteriota bacterium]